MSGDRLKQVRRITREIVSLEEQYFELGVKEIERSTAETSARFRPFDPKSAEDIAKLAELVREGRLLNKKERELIACLLEGKAGFRNSSKRSTRLKISKAHFWLKQEMKSDAAVAILEAAMQIDRSTIYRHLKKAENCREFLSILSVYNDFEKNLEHEFIRKLKKLDLDEASVSHEKNNS